MMSVDDLFSAMRNTSNGAAMQQSRAALISHNLENAADNNYTRLVGEVIPNKGGILAARVTRVSDDWIESNRVAHGAEVGYAAAKSGYLDKVKGLLGRSNAASDHAKLESVVTDFVGSVMDFFQKMQELSNNPFDYTLREFVVARSDDLSRMIRGISHGLSDMKIDVEKDFVDGVKSINGNLAELHSLNQIVAHSTQSDVSLASALDKRQKVLRDIAEQLSITTTQREDGRIIVATDSGLVLVDDFLRELKYRGSFFSLEGYGKLNLGCVGENDKSDILVDLDEVSSGKLKALAEVRDSILPAVIDQMDVFAYSLARGVNEIYSSGSSYPGVEGFQGKKPVAWGEHLDFDGNIKIAVLDRFGSSVEVKEGGFLRPLIVSVADKTVGQLIDEINGYFALNPSRVDFGNGLRDLQLKNVSHDGNILSLQLVGDNAGDSEVVVSLKDANVFYYTYDQQGVRKPNYLGQRLQGELSMTIDPGGVVTSSGVMDLDLSNLPTAIDDFRVKLEVVVDGSRSIVEYTVPNLDSNRFYASAVSGGSGELIKHYGKLQYLRASLVNDDEVEITDFYKPGFIKMEVIDPSSYSIAMAAEDSKERFVDTHSNFIHSMGFNNLFEENSDIAGFSADFAVNELLLKDHHRLNVGHLRDSRGPMHISEVGPADGSIALEIAMLSRQSMDFVKTKYLPSFRSTFVDYAFEIKEHTNFVCYEASKQKEHHEALLSFWEARHDSVAGVDVDEELGNLVLLEHLSSAINKNYGILSEMFDDFVKSI